MNDQMSENPKVAELLEEGRRCIEELDDPVGAEEAFREALELDGRSREAVDRLVTLMRSEQRWVDLVEVLEHRVEVIEDEDPREALSRLRAIAEVQRDRIGDGYAAADALERMLEFGPDGAAGDDQDPIDALSDLYRDQARWDDLAQVLERRFQSETSTEKRTSLAFRLAELYRRHIYRPNRAVDYYRHVLDARPGHRATISALEAMYGEESEPRPRLETLLEDAYVSDERWRDLAALLVRRASLVQHPSEASESLERAFDILDETIGDQELAFELALRWMTQRPTNTRARGEVERLARELGTWEPVVDAYNRVLDAEATDEPDVRSALLTELGDIFEKRLEDPARAREAYSDAVAVRPDDPVAAKGLERVLMRLGDPESLSDFWRRRAERQDDEADAFELLAQTARLEEQVCGRPAEALELWSSLLDRRPRDGEAQSAVERLLNRLERWDDLEQLYRRRIDETEDTGQEADRKSKLAELMESQLDDTSGAIETYGEILDVVPEHRGALRGLEGLRRDLAGRSGDWRAERLRVIKHLNDHYDPQADWRRLVSLEREKRELVEDVHRRADILADEAELIDRYSGDDVERALAVRRLAAAVGLIPHDEQLRERLAELADELEAWNQVPAALLDALTRARNDRVRAELLELVGDVYRRELSDQRSAVTAYRASLDAHLSESALESLESALRNDERWAELADVLEERLGLVEGERKIRVLRRLAGLYDDVLDRPVLAVETYRRLRELEPDEPAYMEALFELSERTEGPPDEEMLERLDRLYQEQGAWQKLEPILQRRLKLAESGEATDLKFRLGYLKESILEDPAAGLEHYRSVLDDEPEHPGALDGLQRISEQHPELEVGAGASGSSDADSSGLL